MNFESLANELLLYVFEYLRTNHLLYQYFSISGINFHSLNSNDSSLICREYFPSFIDKLSPFNLSKDKYSSKPFNQSYSFNPSTLSKLIHCSVNQISVRVDDDVIYPQPTTISSSFTHLHISGEYNSFDLNPIYKSMPNLQYLSIFCGDFTITKVPNLSLQSITSLELSSIIILSDLLNTCQHMTNLYRLKLQIYIYFYSITQFENISFSPESLFQGLQKDR
ncbi:hypothetical protein I4U23_005558 [Adineta vaga]|nr:hypothetical protein I4U23_005558 [Adineta vaga]